MPITPQGIQAWTDLFESSRKRSAERPYYQDIAQASRDEAVGRAGITGAEAQYAPQYFGGRAQEQQARGGLADVNLQYAPRLNEQKLMSGGLSNQLAQLGIQERTRALQNPPMQTDFGKIVEERDRIQARFGEDSPESQKYDAWAAEKLTGTPMEFKDPYAKAMQDRENYRRKYGENSREVQQFDQYLANKFKIDQSAMDPTNVAIDPRSGDPLVNISSSKAANSRFSGGTYVNPNTSEVFAFQNSPSKTRDLKMIAGAETVKQYIDEIKSDINDIYLMNSAAGKGKKFLIENINSFSPSVGEYLKNLGFDMDAPSKAALLDSRIKSSAESFQQQFSLPSTNEALRNAMDIIRPRKGELKSSYLDRLDKQLAEYAEIEQRGQMRLAGGQTVGWLGGEENKGKPVDQNMIDIYLGRVDPKTISQINKYRKGKKGNKKGGITVDLGTGEIR